MTTAPEKPVATCGYYDHFNPNSVPAADILAARSPKGGWTKSQLFEWGIAYPPPRGWTRNLASDDSSIINKTSRFPI